MASDSVGVYHSPHRWMSAQVPNQTHQFLKYHPAGGIRSFVRFGIATTVCFSQGRSSACAERF
jgi:hypothetical protein